ncbi:CHRD domain-containing protein [Marinobacter xestospongiae]|uniref:CHRD domain-containing protein n=1 Tax=Marinobacter xestospongiae TaxID=994319 RepID=A0ABU3W1S0_9GAMM|nr:CHRD domain-containing protein [Marinobacter xestospongiae]MDV2080478.1 CHRD domain-containing protein [Marinobacter xestospongiae]
MSPKSVTTVIALGSLLISSTALAGHTNHVVSTELSADHLVGTMGDADGHGHAHVFGVDGDPTTLCYVLQVSDIQTVPVGDGMAAHIHEAAAGSNGSPIAMLAGPEDGDAADCLTEGEKGKFPTGEAGIVKRILENPQQFYINVHNPEYPAGAIRGQLQAAEHDHGM